MFWNNISKSCIIYIYQIRNIYFFPLKVLIDMNKISFEIIRLSQI